MDNFDNFDGSFESFSSFNSNDRSMIINGFKLLSVKYVNKLNYILVSTDTSEKSQEIAYEYVTKIKQFIKTINIINNIFEENVVEQISFDHDKFREIETNIKSKFSNPSV